MEGVPSLMEAGSFSFFSFSPGSAGDAGKAHGVTP